MKRKFNPYGLIVVMIYVMSIVIWISIGILLWKAIHVVSSVQFIAWLFIWNMFSGIVIILFVILAIKFLDYVDKRFEDNPAIKKE